MVNTTSQGASYAFPANDTLATGEPHRPTKEEIMGTEDAVELLGSTLSVIRGDANDADTAAALLIDLRKSGKLLNSPEAREVQRRLIQELGVDPGLAHSAVVTATDPVAMLTRNADTNTHTATGPTRRTFLKATAAVPFAAGALLSGGRAAEPAAEVRNITAKAFRAGVTKRLTGKEKSKYEEHLRALENVNKENAKKLLEWVFMDYDKLTDYETIEERDMSANMLILALLSVEDADAKTLQLAKLWDSVEESMRQQGGWDSDAPSQSGLVNTLSIWIRRSLHVIQPPFPWARSMVLRGMESEKKPFNQFTARDTLEVLYLTQMSAMTMISLRRATKKDLEKHILPELLANVDVRRDGSLTLRPLKDLAGKKTVDSILTVNMGVFIGLANMTLRPEHIERSDGAFIDFCKENLRRFGGGPGMGSLGLPVASAEYVQKIYNVFFERKGGAQVAALRKLEDNPPVGAWIDFTFLLWNVMTKLTENGHGDKISPSASQVMFKMIVKRGDRNTAGHIFLHGSESDIRRLVKAVESVKFDEKLASKFWYGMLDSRWTETTLRGDVVRSWFPPTWRLGKNNFLTNFVHFMQTPGSDALKNSFFKTLPLSFSGFVSDKGDVNIALMKDMLVSLYTSDEVPPAVRLQCLNAVSELIKITIVNRSREGVELSLGILRDIMPTLHKRSDEVAHLAKHTDDPRAGLDALYYFSFLGHADRLCRVASAALVRSPIGIPPIYVLVNIYTNEELSADLRCDALTEISSRLEHVLPKEQEEADSILTKILPVVRRDVQKSEGDPVAYLNFYKRAVRYAMKTKRNAPAAKPNLKVTDRERKAEDFEFSYNSSAPIWGLIAAAQATISDPDNDYLVDACCDIALKTIDEYEKSGLAGEEEKKFLQKRAKSIERAKKTWGSEKASSKKGAAALAAAGASQFDSRFSILGSRRQRGELITGLTSLCRTIHDERTERDVVIAHGSGYWMGEAFKRMWGAMYPDEEIRLIQIGDEHLRKRLDEINARDQGVIFLEDLVKKAEGMTELRANLERDFGFPQDKIISTVPFLSPYLEDIPRKMREGKLDASGYLGWMRDNFIWGCATPLGFVLSWYDIRGIGKGERVDMHVNYLKPILPDAKIAEIVQIAETDGIEGINRYLEENLLRDFDLMVAEYKAEKSIFDNEAARIAGEQLQPSQLARAVAVDFTQKAHLGRLTQARDAAIGNRKGMGAQLKDNELVIPREYLDDEFAEMIIKGNRSSDITIMPLEEAREEFKKSLLDSGKRQRMILLDPRDLDEGTRNHAEENSRCKVLVLQNYNFLHLGTAVELARSIMAEDAESMNAFYELLKHDRTSLAETTMLTTAQIIFLQAAPVETNLIENINELRQEYAAFVRDA